MRSLFSSASSAISQASERTLQSLEKTKDYVELNNYSEAKVKSIITNSSLPIRMAGTVWKRRGGVSGNLASYSSAWERRLVILKGPYLLYFESSIQPEDHPTAHAVRGILDLPAEQASVQPSFGHDSGAPSPFCLNIQVPSSVTTQLSETKWKLCLDSHALLMEWMAHLTDVMVQASVDQYNQALLEMANPNSVFYVKQQQSTNSTAVLGTASCTTRTAPTVSIHASSFLLQPPPVYEPMDSTTISQQQQSSSTTAKTDDSAPQPLSSPKSHRLWMTESYSIQSPPAATASSTQSNNNNNNTDNNNDPSDNDTSTDSPDHQNALHVMQTLLVEKEKARISLQQQVQDLTHRTAILETQLAHARQELEEHALKDNDDAASAQVVHAQHHAEMEALAHAKELEHAQVQALRKQLEELEQAHAQQLALAASSVDDEHNTDTKELTNYNDDTITNMDVDHEHTIQVLQDRVAQLQDHQTSLTAQLEERKATLQYYETELTTARDELASLQAQLREQESTIHQLETAVKEHQSACETAQSDKSVLEKVLEMLRNNLQDKDAELQQLTNELEQAKENLARMQDASRSIPRHTPASSPLDDERFMKLALKVAERALDVGEVPVGCVITMPIKASNDDTMSDTNETTTAVVSHGANQVNATRDATRHAEIVAIDRMLTGGQSSDQLRLPPNVLAKPARQGMLPSGSPLLQYQQGNEQALINHMDDKWTDIADGEPSSPENCHGWGSGKQYELKIFSKCTLYGTSFVTGRATMLLKLICYCAF